MCLSSIVHVPEDDFLDVSVHLPPWGGLSVQQGSLLLFLPHRVLQAIWPGKLLTVILPMCLPSLCRGAGITDARNRCIWFLQGLWGLNSVIKLTTTTKSCYCWTIALLFLLHLGPFPLYLAFVVITQLCFLSGLSVFASQPHYLHLPNGNKYLSEC